MSSTRKWTRISRIVAIATLIAAVAMPVAFDAGFAAKAAYAKDAADHDAGDNNGHDGPGHR